MIYERAREWATSLLLDGGDGVAGQK